MVTASTKIKIGSTYSKDVKALVATTHRTVVKAAWSVTGGGSCEVEPEAQGGAQGSDCSQ